MTVPVAHKVMREMGVRFNDFGTFGRANRFVRKERQAANTAVAAQTQVVPTLYAGTSFNDRPDV
ncbi:hypothetical protein D3C76_1835430 [compost metagenome]